MTLQELQERVLQLPLQDRWQLVQQLLGSIQQETLEIGLPLNDEQAFPQIQYWTGTSGQANASIKGTGIRVQTIVIANTEWAWDVNKIAEEYDLSPAQVAEALRFYEAHKAEINDAISSGVALEAAAIHA
ncbi:DUF433 domain-containing protein [Leptothoe spongobia]|uniref:DUF433 domain-containing protein n=1 Tax=Leptothoe spongobia TAU-MAC 1115 TaxID=1967444 RepID=A0A947GJ52_9CYAN|nr:DUF433 domain-containing protein [Leptothoe spongobia]MBT9316254.1 DUF433 domain-containing protein [Leptothoe spongobia TAU-MAC 1115]